MSRPSHSSWFDHPNNIGWGYNLLGSLSCIQGKEKLGTERSQSVENSFWKRLLPCFKTDYKTMMIDDFMSPATIVCLYLHAKYQIFFPILPKFGLSRKIFKEVFTTKIHENPSFGSQAYTCGQTDGQADRQIDTKKLIGIFANMRKRQETELSPHFPICFHSLAVSSNISSDRICRVCYHFFCNKEPVF